MPQAAQHHVEDAAVRRVVVDDQHAHAREGPQLRPGARGRRRRAATLERAASTWNVLPVPGSLSTQMRPPISATSWVAMVKPEAGAAVAAGRGRVGLRERLEDRSPASPAGCRCRCRARRSAARPCRRRRGHSRSTRDHDLAALGELDGVADQVDEDLPQAPGIADQRVGHVGADRGTPARGPSRAPASASRRDHVAAARRGRSKSMRVELELPRFDLREIEDVVDDRRAASRRELLTDLQVLALLGGQLGVEQRARSCR